MNKQQLLDTINRDLPDFDWKEGARAYVQSYFDKYDRESVEQISFVKPLTPITPEDPKGSLTEAVSYLTNFANIVRLLDLPRGSRILDVACGGGWFSHWLVKLGYETYGIDISADFVELARKRITLDPHINANAGSGSFEVLDIEVSPLPEERRGTFDAVVLESCLHHFFDPISALEHIRDGLKPDGVVLIIEGENRTGPIREEYWKVMRETRTLERPYSRDMLTAILKSAGLGEFCFLGSVDGYVAEGDPKGKHLAAYLDAVTSGRNTCVAATHSAAIRRIVPSHGTARASEPQPQLRLPWLPLPLRRVLRRLRDASMGPPGSR